MPKIPKILADTLIKPTSPTEAKPSSGNGKADKNGTSIKPSHNKISASLIHMAVEIDTLVPDPQNARLHSDKNVDAIMKSLSSYGQVKPVVVRKSNNVVVAGNGTLEAARGLGWTMLAANFVDMTDLDAAGYGLADNRTAELATWDFEVVSMLNQMLLENDGDTIGWGSEDLALLLRDQSETDQSVVPTLNLSERFVIPPFSVLDARQGYWQERKRQWLSLGIQSELGRGQNLGDISASLAGITDPVERELCSKARRKDNGLLGFSEQARSHYKTNATPGGSPRPATTLGKDGKTVRGDGRDRPLATTKGSGAPGDLAKGFKEKQTTLGAVAPNQSGKDGILTRTGKYATASPYGAYGKTDDTSVRITNAQPQSGTSIFDPVICELTYRWFTPPNGHVFDPFAGGSVRGIVAAKLGRRYTGIDLRPEQAEANVIQAETIVPNSELAWIVGDAIDANEIANNEYDLIFSCPPYADLERYSDDPRDLSTMSYEDFLAAYNKIIANACGMLKQNRFACFVVGDIRDKKGIYRGFVGDTVLAFAAAGLDLYNDAVLVTAVGSLPIRVGRQFSGYRKLGKTHQNVLVFIKGDPKRAVQDCGPVEVGNLEELLSIGEIGFTDEVLES